MKRIRFLEKKGQRRFLEQVIERVNATSLRGLLQFGISTKYSTLKNYFSEERLLPEELFEELCEIGKIDREELSFEVVDENWGQKKGGQKSRK